MSRFYRNIINVVRVIFLFYLRIEIKGKENIPKEGAFIVCANHRSMLDAVVLALKFDRQIHFLGKAELFKNKLFKWIFTKLEVIPTKRHEVDLNVIRQANKVLKEGKILGIFPEGTRVRTGKLAEFEPGTSMLAIRNKVDVLPVMIHGKYGFMRKIIINVGKPFDLSEFYGERTSIEMFGKATEIIRQKVSEL